MINIGTNRKLFPGNLVDMLNAAIDHRKAHVEDLNKLSDSDSFSCSWGAGCADLCEHRLAVIGEIEELKAQIKYSTAHRNDSYKSRFGFQSDRWYIEYNIF